MDTLFCLVYGFLYVQYIVTFDNLIGFDYLLLNIYCSDRGSSSYVGISFLQYDVVGTHFHKYLSQSVTYADTLVTS